MSQDESAAKALQNALDDAVEAFYKGDPNYDGYVLTHYVLVATHICPPLDGEGERTSYSRAYMGNSMPYFMILGLLDYALHRTRAETLHEEDWS